ncbi:MAG: hypothetical protein K0Q49_2245 [Haloplasmataceae bacterium]|nr:hypothetical protein [Haloplasmataceae bacterium]
MKTVLTNLFDAINLNNYVELNEFIDENCLLINYDSKATLSKSKIIEFLSVHRSNINHLNLINSVQDFTDTLLIAFSVLFNNDKLLFGSSIIRFKNSKIYFIKIIIV